MGEKELQNALQFAAKIHEVLIMASLSAMVLHVARRMLMSGGIAWGLLAGAHQVGSVPWLFSSAFLSPLARWQRISDLLLACVLGAGVIYANLVAPASAIVIIPSLDWWPVPNPFNGQTMATYVVRPHEDVYPAVLGEDQIYAQCNNTDVLCPGGGQVDIVNLMTAMAVGGVHPVTAVKMPGAETYRTLNATIQYSASDNAVAVATTLHSSVADVLGTFWNYISRNKVGLVNDVRRPRFEPTVDDIKAPVVQVQCTHFSWLDSLRGLERPAFRASGMRNLTGDGTGHRLYRDITEWDLPGEYWNYTRDDLNVTTFRWLDTESLFPDSGPSRPSLGAMATVPMPFAVTLGNGTKEFRQDSMIVPCLIDARWVGTSTSYDPRADNRLPSNISDLSVLARFWDGTSRRPVPGGLSSENVAISPDWAHLLDTEIGFRETAGNEVMHMTAVESYLSEFVYKGKSAISGAPMRFFTPPKNDETLTTLGDQDMSDLDLELDDMDRTIATILSLAVADGLSRATYTKNIGLVTRDYGNGSVAWQSLWHQAGEKREEEELIPATDLDDYYRLDWVVQRHGWAYGLRETTVIFAVVVLLIHVALVALYALYTLYFRTCGGGWASTAWGGVHTILALALASPAPANENLTRRLEKGRDAETQARVVVQAGGGAALVLRAPDKRWRGS